jgi:cardiolipin synthase
MMKTAEAMGVSVYEDFPAISLSLDDINNPSSGGYQTGGASLKKSFPVPEPDPDIQTSKPVLSFSEKANIYWGYVLTFWHSVTAQITDSGVFSAGAPSFEEISKEILARVFNTSFKPRKYGERSLFEVPGFISEYENIVGSKFRSGNSVKFLINGEESFKYKDYLIKNAKKSIYITTWAFYDDITGADALKMLSEKKRQGIDVKVITDGNIINSHGISIVGKMEKAGIEVIRYSEKVRRADIWHVKMIIVDEKYAIVGGMNFGDPYSHKDPNGAKWRDTDVLYMGPAVSDSLKIYARIWNDEVSSKGLKLGKINLPEAVNPSEGNAKISITFSNPPESDGSPILAGIIKAIYGATKSINIENAYFVPIPTLTQAILDARARGVEVSIFTNSKDSIDSEAKSVSDISMKSLLPLYKAGVKIYLKKGDTLHSKFMTVDGVFCSIGSYNLHPRGERYDSELNLNILDPETVSGLDKVFKMDIMNLATEVKAETDLVPDQSWFSRIVEKYFYSQLGKKTM